MANMMKKLLKKSEDDTNRTAKPLKASKNASASGPVEPSVNRVRTTTGGSGNSPVSGPDVGSPSAQQPGVAPSGLADPQGDDPSSNNLSKSAIADPETSTSNTAVMPEKASAASVLGPGLIVEGELHASEDLTILGVVTGSVHHQSDLLTIGTTGVVSAQIHAHSLVVQGRVEGDIHCSVSVKITESATVIGNINTSRLSIADGAKFSGKIDMS